MALDYGTEVEPGSLSELEGADYEPSASHSRTTESGVDESTSDREDDNIPPVSSYSCH